MEKLSTAQLLAMFKSKSYILNDTPYYPNLFGVRKETNIPNQFDDFIGAVWKDKYGAWLSCCYEGTTDPGMYWLEHPMNVNGTAIIVPDQYLGVYKLGQHMGYAAYEEIKPFTYVRDTNKDKILNWLYRTVGYKKYVENGKTNLHHAGELVNNPSTFVEKWSAGCQVVKRILEFGCLLELGQNWVNLIKGINSFNYTLFEEKDICEVK
jgi:hypothetical protein